MLDKLGVTLDMLENVAVTFSLINARILDFLRLQMYRQNFKPHKLFQTDMNY